MRPLDRMVLTAALFASETPAFRCKDPTAEMMVRRVLRIADVPERAVSFDLIVEALQSHYDNERSEHGEHST